MKNMTSEPDRLELDRDAIGRLLARSGIDCRPDDERELYVTGLAFNF